MNRTGDRLAKRRRKACKQRKEPPRRREQELRAHREELFSRLRRVGGA